MENNLKNDLDISPYGKSFKRYFTTIRKIQKKSFSEKYILQTLSIISESIEFYKNARNGESCIEELEKMYWEMRNIYIRFFRENDYK